MDDSYKGPSLNELRILSVIRQIPRGHVLTYADVARLADLGRRARLVGRVLRSCPLADGVPWHRVVAAPGKIAVRDGPGAGLQARLLRSEGIEVDAAGRLELESHRWRGPVAETEFTRKPRKSALESRGMFRQTRGGKASRIR